MTDYTRAMYYKRAFVVALVLFLVTLALLILMPRPQIPEPTVVVEHDTMWRDTTIYQPSPTDSTQTGRTVYIRVPYPVEVPGDTVHDSIQVPLPIIQKRYDDSLYTAWVSGFRPALDSIRLYQPEIITTVTQTIVKPAPRFSIGPAIGAGVSIDRERHMGIYVGFTAQYRLWPK